MDPDVWQRHRKYLGSVRFPASKEQLLAAADRTGDPGLHRLIADLPLGTYDNLDEVRRSVTLDRTAEDERGR